MDKQMQIELRDYQQETIDALIQWCKENPEGNPVLELPTGSGKSVIIAEFCRQMAKRGRKVLVLCRQKELVLQNKERFTQRM
jgi:DNA repair protein RadD